jgi:hypothetical protein
VYSLQRKAIPDSIGCVRSTGYRASALFSRRSSTGTTSRRRNLSLQEEFERNRKYYAEHGMDVPIAVGDRISATSPNPNDTNYKVGSIPQIHLIDKKGRIHLVMVGYDDANEPKLAKMIEDLLKEN